MDADATLILTLVRSVEEKSRVRLLFESLQRFGGLMGECPACCFETDPALNMQKFLKDLPVQVLPLNAPQHMAQFAFGDKVFACAKAESMAGASVKTLVWMDPGLIVIMPPLLYDLDPPYRAALRPVHLQNIGLSKTDEPDAFWQKILETAAARQIKMTVASFVEGAQLQASFNMHAFAVDPSLGLMQKWSACYEALVTDPTFVSDFLADTPYHTFLHQALFSTILAAHLEADHIRMLPPEYNYPYHLQDRIPDDRRATAINDLVTVVYETRYPDPETADDIDIHEPLYTWLNPRSDRRL